MKVKDIVKLCGKLLDFDFDQTVFDNADNELIEQALIAGKLFFTQKIKTSYRLRYFV